MPRKLIIRGLYWETSGSLFCEEGLCLPNSTAKLPGVTAILGGGVNIRLRWDLRIVRRAGAA